MDLRETSRFERAISQVPLTWPSHAAILTGTYPFQNGVQDFTGQPLGSQFRSVAQAFKQHGYATERSSALSFLIVAGDWSRFRLHMTTHFQRRLFNRKTSDSQTAARTRALRMRLRGSRRLRSVLFFLWLHLYDPHSPYDAPEIHSCSVSR